MTGADASGSPSGSPSGNAAGGESAGVRKLVLLQRLAIVLGPWLLRAMRATWRVRLVNAGAWRALQNEGKPFVFSLWHGELLPLVIEHRNQGVRILVSEHGDGEVIAQIAHRLGLATIRGSSSRGGARALLAMCEALSGGAAVAVTPDGPRGPTHKYATGALVAANRAGVPIIAIGVSATSAWRLRSWDAFLIPKPFSRVVIAYSEPVYVNAPDARAAAALAGALEGVMEATAASARSVSGALA